MNAINFSFASITLCAVIFLAPHPCASAPLPADTSPSIPLVWQKPSPSPRLRTAPPDPKDLFPKIYQCCLIAENHDSLFHTDILRGVSYSFAHDPKRHPRETDYWSDLRKIIEGKLTPQAFAPYYKSNRLFHFTHLFPSPETEIPNNGITHYAGMLLPEESGHYRFVGHFGDAIVILVDGEIVLEAESGCEGKTGLTGWVPTDFVGEHPSPVGREWLVYGDWVELSSTQPRRIDLILGERLGGKTGGILLIQKKGVDYPLTAEGRPILPIFMMSPIPFSERFRLENNKQNGFEFNMTIPIMNTLKINSTQMRERHDIRIRNEDL